MKRLIKKSQFDNIDSLRFLAFLAIFISHTFITSNQQIKLSSLFSDLRQVTANLNSAAYSLLFILTGFLNTWTIFEERFIYKKMNTLRFYMRRILGILPVYFLVFVIGYYILPKLLTGVPIEKVADVSLPGYLTFSFNQGYSNADNLLHAVVGNMWSIAVTMQFIIFWPIVMNYFRRRETTLFVLCFLTFGVSALFWSDSASFPFSTLNCLFDLTAGSYLAYICFFKYQPYTWLKTVTRRSIAFVYVVFFGFILFKSTIYAYFVDVPMNLLFIGERILMVGMLAFFVFEQHFNSQSLLKLAKLKIFNAPGKFAYSLYAYHAIGIIAGYRIMTFLVSEESMVSILILEPVLALIITATLVMISYEFFEKKFIRLKKNYTPTREFNPTKEDAKAKPA